jgi:hypothetical protein
VDTSDFNGRWEFLARLYQDVIETLSAFPKISNYQLNFVLDDSMIGKSVALPIIACTILYHVYPGLYLQIARREKTAALTTALVHHSKHENTITPCPHPFQDLVPQHVRNKIKLEQRQINKQNEQSATKTCWLTKDRKTRQ